MPTTEHELMILAQIDGLRRAILSGNYTEYEMAEYKNLLKRYGFDEFPEE